MSETGPLLEGAARTAPPPTFDVETLRGRRDRKRRSERIRAGAVALSVMVAASAFAFTALRETDGSAFASGVHGLPPATRAMPVAAAGESYYLSVDYRSEGCFGSTEDGICGAPSNRLVATYRWSPADDSGSIDVQRRDGFGIDEGAFGPGEFPNPNGIDVSAFPTEPSALEAFLLDRSAEDGPSPAPLVTPPPEGAATDGQLWRAITDLLRDPHTTPTVRAALLEVAANLQGSTVANGVVDPVGRPADTISFGNWGGDTPERLYVDPATHDLLAWTVTSNLEWEASSMSIFVVRDAGVVASSDAEPRPSERTVPTSDIPLPSGGETTGASGATAG
jgi:hypothetical protein